MPFKKLLNRILMEKGYTNAEIIKKCNDMGVKIDKSYFARITNERNKIIPSEKIIRAIAKACDTDERKLIVESYIDKAPKEIIDTFKVIKTMQIMAGMKYIELQNIVKKIDVEKLVEDEPLGDIAIDMLEQYETYEDFLKNGFIYEKINNELGFSVSLKEPQGMPIEDDAMSPIIQKGDKVTIQMKEQYNSSDIVIVKYKEKIMIRYMCKINNIIKLFAINKEYKDIIDKKENIEVLACVGNVIRKI